MNNLTTRKIVLGMLMALVLAFSVQGIADALTFGTTRTGDLQTVLPNHDFSITFRPDLVNPVDVNDFLTPAGPRHRRASATDIANAPRTASDPVPITSNFTVTEDSGYQPGYTHYYTVTTTTPGVRNTANTADVTRTTHTRNWTTEAAAYYYNAEQVMIAVTTGGATLKKVGRYDAPSDGVLMETGEDGSKLLDSTMTLTFTAPSNGAEQTITISDTTTGDYPAVVTTARPLVFTVYVVQPQSAVQTATTTFATNNDGVEYAYENEDRQINSYFTFSEQNAPVNYSVEGTGRVYISLGGDRRTRSASTLWTSSNAPVYLETNRGTSKVTAWISGTDGMTAIFIFSGPSPDKYPRVEIIQGDNQTGALGGQLEDYLEVKVTDGNRRPISGVAVQFDDDPSAGVFRPVPGTDVYVDGSDALVDALANSINADTFTATPTLPVAGEDIFVQTDSSGLAKVYYELSNTAGVARIDALLTGTTIDVTFRAEGVEDSRKASLRMVSGDGQSADKGDPIEDPLVVLARSTAGYRIPGVNIRLTTSTGTLSRSVGTALAAGSVSSGNNIVVMTGADGTASVEYNVGQLVVARTVTASIDNEQSVHP